MFLKVKVLGIHKKVLFVMKIFLMILIVLKLVELLLNLLCKGKSYLVCYKKGGDF